MDIPWVTAREAWEDEPTKHPLLPSGKAPVRPEVTREARLGTDMLREGPART